MIYNVKDFGAKGNGSADDTTAIQAAVNAAHAAGGGQVYIPAGTYIVHGGAKDSAGCIMLYDNITVYGEGMGATTVKLKDGSSQDITGIFRTPYGVENHDIGMHNLTIDGNRANTSGKVDGWFNGVRPEKNTPLDPNEAHDTNITLNNLEIKNCSGYGFDPHEKTVNLSITNSISHGNGLDGFTLDGQQDAHIENNIAYDNDRHGFNIVTSSHEIELTNNTAYGNGSDGIIVQRGSNDVPVPENVVISGGHYYDNGGNGIEINKADSITVDGADIHDNALRGVRIYGSTGSSIENSALHDNSQAKNNGYAEISLQGYDDTNGVSGHVYMTSGTQILNNTITDDGAVRALAGVQEYADGMTDSTTVSKNTIIGTNSDVPLLSGSHSTFTEPALVNNTNPNGPTILYAPLLGQSNANLMFTSAPDGGSGLSHVENGLKQQTGLDQIVTMTNMAVGSSTVNGDNDPNQDPAKVWWYAAQNKPGADLLNAVDQMQHQISELRAEGNNVTPVVIWAQGEAEANPIGSIKTEAGRQAAEQQYINETRAVFDYIKSHVDPNIQFYIMETGRFNTTGAQNAGYAQTTIDKINLGLNYIHDAQIKMALAYGDVHLATNYSDLPTRADMPSSTPGYSTDWAKDVWHLAPSSQETEGDRLSNFISVDMGFSHVIDKAGPYPYAALADLTIQGGSGLTITGNDNGNIIVGTIGHDIISGKGGNDIIVGGGGGDTMTGGAGRDVFYYSASILKEVQAAESNSSLNIRDTITDFQTGTSGDAIDLSGLLQAAGYTGKDAIADKYINFRQSGSDTIISFDQDGASSSHHAVDLIKLSGITMTSFDTAHNLLPASGTTLAGGNHPPVANDDNFIDAFNQPLTGNVLANNGHGPDSDPDGDTLSVTAISGQTTAGGHIDLHADGSFSYAPQLGFAGADSFNYTLLDSHGASDTATANIQVAASPGAIIGTNGIDSIYGTSGNDVILGLSGNDTLNGGSGNDTIYSGPGTSTLYGGSGDDTLYAVNGSSTLYGGSGNDALHAVSGNNTLYGNDDNDMLYAGTGNDILYGNNGDDVLVAGTGSATMTGGSGADTFAFLSANTGNNIITDFHLSTNDKIDISDVLQGYDPAHNAISDFVHATKQSGGIVLSVDPDGTANGAHFHDIALLQGVNSFDITKMIASGNLIV